MRYQVVFTVKETQFTVIQQNFAAWIGLYRLQGHGVYCRSLGQWNEFSTIAVINLRRNSLFYRSPLLLMATLAMIHKVTDEANPI